MKNKVFVALGSNLGDCASHIRGAIKSLKALAAGKSWVLSPLYKTVSVGGPGPDYLNAVCSFETKLSAEAVFAFLMLVEKKAGRKRTARNAPRILDLDFLFYGPAVIQMFDLTVPHPHLHRRAFVLAPLNDIAPEWVHPLLNQSVSEMLALLSVSDLQGVEKL